MSGSCRNSTGLAPDPLEVAACHRFAICPPWTLFIYRDKELVITLVQFSHSIVSDSLQSHGLQHTRLPCPSPTPRAYSNSFSLRWGCHTDFSSSVIPFSSCLQIFPSLRVFSNELVVRVRWPSIGVPASASVLPTNIQD